MRLTNRDIIEVNQSTRERNRTARYHSPEEKQFTLAGTAGMLLMWNPYISKEKISSKNAINKKNIGSSQSIKNTQNGLPVEIGQFIGSYLDRKDAAKVVQVCRNANDSACNAKDSFVEKNGKSYKEESYTPLVFII